MTVTLTTHRPAELDDLTVDELVAELLELTDRPAVWRPMREQIIAAGGPFAMADDDEDDDDDADEDDEEEDAEPKGLSSARKKIANQRKEIAALRKKDAERTAKEEKATGQHKKRADRLESENATLKAENVELRTRGLLDAAATKAGFRRPAQAFKLAKADDLLADIEDADDAEQVIKDLLADDPDLAKKGTRTRRRKDDDDDRSSGNSSTRRGRDDDDEDDDEDDDDRSSSRRNGRRKAPALRGTARIAKGLAASEKKRTGGRGK